MSSATSGRTVPALQGTLIFTDWAFSVSATGVKSPLYYHSAYLATFHKLWSSGSFFWGSLRAGLGGGLFFASRGFREDPSQSVDSTQDLALGPSFLVNWYFLGPCYISLESLYGIRSPWSHLMLSFQDVTILSLGFQL